MPLEALNFPAGNHLLARWQANDPQAIERLRIIMDATIKGQYDEIFKRSAPQDAVHVSGPVDLMTLTIMHRLYGLTSAEFYKEGPERFVCTSLMVQKLLDMNTGIPKLLDEALACYQRLTGLNPVLHLTAPYSLAADIYGQEPIIDALTHEPEFVNRFLDHLADTVLEPWMDHFFSQHPDGWVEFSDASGSPFFIGPQNCKNVAIRSTQRLIAANPWGGRVYDANYRGDYVTQANKGNSSTARRRRCGKSNSEQFGLIELFELKNSVCPDYVIRLHDDRTPASFYVEQAVKYNIPLFMGIGATQVDRNSIADGDISKQEIKTTTSEYVEAVKIVARTIARNGYESRMPPWPGAVYFEDISAESNFELIEIIVDTTLKQGAL